MTTALNRRLTVVGQCEASLGGRTIRYVIKRSPRARYVRLEVKSDTGLTVVIPKTYRADRVAALLTRKSDWILSKLADHAELEQYRLREEVHSGDTIPYLGRDLEVVVLQAHEGVERVEMVDGRLLLGSETLRSSFGSLLERWYRKQADEVIRKRADELCARLGLSYSRLSVRRARTRWGSCSCKGNLNFNWGLMMMPEQVIDYVIVHELTHLTEMNHARNFWALVADRCPRWREHRRWIREHEALLTARMSTLGGR